MKNEIKIRKKIQRKIWLQLNLGWLITLSVIFGILILTSIIGSMISFSYKDFNEKESLEIPFLYYVGDAISEWLQNGPIESLSTAITSNGLFFILPLALFFVNLEYKIRNIYIRRTLLITTYEKNIKFIPLISSLIFLSYAILTFIIIDLIGIAAISANTKYSLTSDFFKNELLGLTKFLMYYIFITGITYIVVDLFRYKMDKKFVQKATNTILIPVLIFEILLPIISLFFLSALLSHTYVEAPLIGYVRKTIINYEFATVLAVFESIFYVLINPFKIDLVVFAGLISDAADKNGFNFITPEQADIILWVFRSIYTVGMLSYLGYRYFWKSGKYE